MREILFRGKCANNGVWLLGDCRRWRPDRIGIHDYDLHHTIEIIPETLGQYTGLTDKNGKKIFEGDIVSAKIESGASKGYEWPIMPVVFSHCGFALHDDREDVYLSCYAPTVTFEVIGNIHDHPELLEVQHE